MAAIKPPTGQDLQLSPLLAAIYNMISQDPMGGLGGVGGMVQFPLTGMAAKNLKAALGASTRIRDLAGDVYSPTASLLGTTPPEPLTSGLLFMLRKMARKPTANPTGQDIIKQYSPELFKPATKKEIGELSYQLGPWGHSF